MSVGTVIVDLHAHSTASDGSAAPAAAVELAHQAGVAAFALTDHDTMAGIDAAQEAAVRLGLRFIPGVELSVHQDAQEVHLLGLHIADVAGMEQALTTFRDGRRLRAQAMVDRLIVVGAPIDFAAVLAAAAGGAIGRPHVAKALVAAGHVKDHREAFDKYLAAGRPAYVDKARLEIADGIALIHRFGGLAIIAHPGPEGRRERLEPLVALGLDGVEVKHPSHSAEDAKRILALVDHLGLVPSGGSDWHGAMMGPRTLGAMQVPMAWLERQDARLAARRAAA